MLAPVIGPAMKASSATVPPTHSATITLEDER